MHHEKESEFLIVGHGLAGALMTDALERHGQKPIVADALLEHAASPAAAGIMNPVIGPSLNSPWRAYDCLKKAKETYRRLEEDWDEYFFRELRMLRIFQDEKMIRRWNDKLLQEETAQFLGRLWSKEELKEIGVDGSLGAGEVMKTGALDVMTLVRASREHLKTEGRYLQKAVHPMDRTWNGRTIFCEGFRVVNNPWFKELPFAPAKGEVLELEDTRKEFLNGGTWFIPGDKDTALAGSTYEWKNLESGPTREGADEILNGLNYLSEPTPVIRGQRSGVRPATRDRMPIVGAHPIEEKMLIFNGFGSRGSSLIPLCAELFASHLIEGKELPEAIDLQRFKEAKSLGLP